MAEPDIEKRRDAEQRVLDRYARQQASLDREQAAERRRDWEMQKRALAGLTAERGHHEEEKARALNRLDLEWKRQRDRLALRPKREPVFTLMDPPRREIDREYRDLQRRWSESRERTIQAYDKRIAACAEQRAQMLDRFREQNEARALAQYNERKDLLERQQRGFERLVAREIERAPNSLRRTFNTHSRSTGEGRGR